MKSFLTSVVCLNPAVGLKKRKKRVAGGQNIDLSGWPTALRWAYQHSQHDLVTSGIKLV